MRHRKKINHLGRTASHRQATLANMASSLIIHKRISTTLAKAKVLKVYVEPLITKSKVDSTHSRRTVFSSLGNKNAVSELFREISQKIADRPGGYTRILKTGFRKGDGAEMCFIELVDYNLNMLKSAEESQQKRTRRGKAKKKDDAAALAKKDKVVEKTEPEAIVEDEPKAEETQVVETESATEASVETETEEKKDEEEKASE
ncbi:MAG: 50S ribosomal protein L17 [Bacteroidetes bacterium]|nr:50S ribosomal protein L17 [Bacteroidota bacterium]